MGKRVHTKVTDGYTITEVLITISISLLLITAISSSYITYTRAQQSSLQELSIARRVLQADIFFREKTSELKVSYWLDPMDAVTAFITDMYAITVAAEVSITNVEYLFNSKGFLRGVQYYYTVSGSNKVYESTCHFTFRAIIAFNNQQCELVRTRVQNLV